VRYLEKDDDEYRVFRRQLGRKKGISRSRQKERSFTKCNTQGVLEYLKAPTGRKRDRKEEASYWEMTRIQRMKNKVEDQGRQTEGG
jgi:hypothetical protein